MSKDKLQELRQLIKTKREEALEKYPDVPKLTEEESLAVDKYANKKNELFKRVLNSPEQVEKVKRMLKV